MKKTKTLAALAALTALQVILRRFISINTQLTTIGFGFLPVVVSGALYGPAAGAAVGGVSDFLGAVLFPVGPYFPGFTLTAVLTGGLYGLVLHRRRTLPRVLLASAGSQLVLSLFLNTLWITLLYGSDYWAIFTTARLAQCAGMFPVEAAVTWAISPGLREMERRGWT